MNLIEKGSYGNSKEALGSGSLYVNRLIFGDNLVMMNILMRDFKGRINVIYIDPPYNTGFKFEQYNDNIKSDLWGREIHLRLCLFHELLKDDGILIIQIDDNEHAYLLHIADSIFGKNNRLKTIIWRRRQSQANLSDISTIHDYIIFYAKDISKVDEKIKHAIDDNVLMINPTKFGHNQLSSIEMKLYFDDKRIFSTPKPELLMYHLLRISSHTNDLILDAYAGSGTTLAVAHKLGRKWIGIEREEHSFQLIRSRLKNIIMNPEDYITKIDSLQGIVGKGKGTFCTYQLDKDKYDKNNLDVKKEYNDPLNWIKNLSKKKNRREIRINSIQTGIYSPQDLYGNKNILDFQDAFNSLYFLRTIIIEQGFIFVFASENNYKELKIMLDHIFNQSNFMGTFIWKIKNDYKYLLFYAKNKDTMNFHKLPPNDKLYFNPDGDTRGPWLSHPLVASKKSSNKSFTYIFKDGRTITKKWRYPENSIKKLEKEDRIHYTHPKKGVGIPRVKKFFAERLAEFNNTGKRGTTPNTILENFTFDELYRFILQISSQNLDRILNIMPNNSQLLEKLENNEKISKIRVLINKKE